MYNSLNTIRIYQDVLKILLTNLKKLCIIKIENEKPQTWFPRYRKKHIYNSQVTDVFFIYYADFNSSLNLSAIIAINSEFVGFPLAAEIVYPNIFSTASC